MNGTNWGRSFSRKVDLLLRCPQSAPFFAGYDRERIPEFQMHFASDIQQDMIQYLEDILGKGRVFYAGAYDAGRMMDSRAMVRVYCRDHKIRRRPVNRYTNENATRSETKPQWR